MIATAVIIGAGVIIGTGLLIKFWNTILQTVKKIIEKVSNVGKGVLKGVKVFLRRTSDGFVQITKSYSQDIETKKWYETVVKKNLLDDEVPTEIKEKCDALDGEFDITDEFELQLSAIA